MLWSRNGNQTGTQSGGGALAYNAQDQTTSITPAGGSAVSMGYHGVGQSERTTRGTTSFRYDQNGLGSSTDTTTSKTTYFTTTPAGDVISERIPSGAAGCPSGGPAVCSYYYLHDGLGSVVAVTDSNGNVVNQYAYDPYVRPVLLKKCMKMRVEEAAGGQPMG